MSSPPPPPSGKQQPDTPISNSPEKLCFGLPEYALFQKEEIPAWMARVYDQFDKQDELPGLATGSPHNLREDSEETLASQEGLFLHANDDMDIGLGDYGRIDSLSSPFSIDRGILLGQPRSPRPIVFWIAIFMAMFSVLIAAFFLGKENRNFSQTISSILPFKKTEMSKLQFSDLNDYRFNRGKKGPSVFIIQGKVTNNYESTCHAIEVKAILFDEKNKKIAEKTGYCGNILKKKEIKSYSQKKINKILKNPKGSTKQNANIKSGQSIPFMVIFFGPPEKEFEYSIEILKYDLDHQEENKSPTKQAK